MIDVKIGNTPLAEYAGVADLLSVNLTDFSKETYTLAEFTEEAKEILVRKAKATKAPLFAEQELQITPFDYDSAMNKLFTGV